jgi:hypothetical protein
MLSDAELEIVSSEDGDSDVGGALVRGCSSMIGQLGAEATIVLHTA